MDVMPHNRDNVRVVLGALLAVSHSYDIFFFFYYTILYIVASLSKKSSRLDASASIIPGSASGKSTIHP